MKKFEYKIIWLLEHQDAKEILNKLGSDGWEVILVFVPRPANYSQEKVYLKRELGKAE